MTSQQNLFGFADTPEWEQAAAEDFLVADVVFNLPLERPYTYRIPDELRELTGPGHRVRAPLGRGNRSVIGYCVAVRRGESGQMRLKTIEELLDTQPLADGRM
ncbi:MAG: primosomal protein N', partial [Planctomyces sp.]